MNSHERNRKKSGVLTAFLAVVVLLTSGFAIPIGIVVNRPTSGRSAAVVKRCQQDVETAAERSNRAAGTDERGDRKQSILRWLM